MPQDPQDLIDAPLVRTPRSLLRRRSHRGPFGKNISMDQNFRWGPQSLERKANDGPSRNNKKVKPTEDVTDGNDTDNSEPAPAPVPVKVKKRRGCPPKVQPSRYVKPDRWIPTWHLYEQNALLVAGQCVECFAHVFTYHQQNVSLAGRPTSPPAPELTHNKGQGGGIARASDTNSNSAGLVPVHPIVTSAIEPAAPNNLAYVLIPQRMTCGAEKRLQEKLTAAALLPKPRKPSPGFYKSRPDDSDDGFNVYKNKKAQREYDERKRVTAAEAITEADDEAENSDEEAEREGGAMDLDTSAPEAPVPVDDHAGSGMPGISTTDPFSENYTSGREMEADHQDEPEPRKVKSSKPSRAWGSTKFTQELLKKARLAARNAETPIESDLSGSDYAAGRKPLDLEEDDDDNDDLAQDVVPSSPSPHARTGENNAKGKGVHNLGAEDSNETPVNQPCQDKGKGKAVEVDEDDPSSSDSEVGVVSAVALEHNTAPQGVYGSMEYQVLGKRSGNLWNYFQQVLALTNPPPVGEGNIAERRAAWNHHARELYRTRMDPALTTKEEREAFASEIDAKLDELALQEDNLRPAGTRMNGMIRDLQRALTTACRFNPDMAAFAIVIHTGTDQVGRQISGIITGSEEGQAVLDENKILVQPVVDIVADIFRGRTSRAKATQAVKRLNEQRGEFRTGSLEEAAVIVETGRNAPRGQDLDQSEGDDDDDVDEEDDKTNPLGKKEMTRRQAKAAAKRIAKKDSKTNEANEMRSRATALLFQQLYKIWPEAKGVPFPDASFKAEKFCGAHWKEILEAIVAARLSIKDGVKLAEDSANYQELSLVITLTGRSLLQVKDHKGNKGKKPAQPAQSAPLLRAAERFSTATRVATTVPATAPPPATAPTNIGADSHVRFNEDTIVHHNQPSRPLFRNPTPHPFQQLDVEDDVTPPWSLHPSNSDFDLEKTQLQRALKDLRARRAAGLEKPSAGDGYYKPYQIIGDGEYPEVRVVDDHRRPAELGNDIPIPYRGEMGRSAYRSLGVPAQSRVVSSEAFYRQLPHSNQPRSSHRLPPHHPAVQVQPASLPTEPVTHVPSRREPVAQSSRPAGHRLPSHAQSQSETAQFNPNYYMARGSRDGQAGPSNEVFRSD
ncbi:hypothetical protein GALMADRAFT_144514 [Galerina marginata CBS 339.88]|uniref:Uncharacterized protein n=1 Tax=Galerina marginata (strain CBS 339.88) TaxID=685588 RepID=A0A067SI75_GALM3|nr:hypothetical protein GALMADRAFT_144514 [Galerina marginata CBS 339.88]